MYLILICLAQILLSLLDLVAVLLLGLVALVATTGIQSVAATPLGSILELPAFDGRSDEFVAITLAATAGTLMVTRSAASFILTRVTFQFLASAQADIAGRLVETILARPLAETLKRSSQDIAYSLTVGVSSITLGVLGFGTMLVTEAALLVVLGVALFAIDPIVTVFTVAYFAVVGFGLHKAIAAQAYKKGRRSSAGGIASIQSIQELILTYRELAAAGRREYFVEEFKSVRRRYAHDQASIQVMTQSAKYVFEIALIVGGAALAFSQFLSGSTPQAIAIIAVFLAAASRIMPALLRMQAAALGVKTNAGLAVPALNYIDEVRPHLSASPVPNMADERGHTAAGTRNHVERTSGTFDATVECEGLAFTYPGSLTPVLRDINLRVPQGTSLAVVGATGAGKSTLLDLLLGILPSGPGCIRISGCPPQEATKSWPGRIAYVPQTAHVVEGTVRRNITLGLRHPESLSNEIWRVLEQVRLADLFRDAQDGLETQVGEGGIRLSGGQRQRMSLARALLTQPELILLDEATSALDAETEHAISETINSLSGRVTLIVSAHRLTTVRNMDQLIFLEVGKEPVLGTFSEVRERVPSFARQAELLGL